MDTAPPFSYKLLHLLSDNGRKFGQHHKRYLISIITKEYNDLTSILLGMTRHLLGQGYPKNSCLHCSWERTVRGANFAHFPSTRTYANRFNLNILAEFGQITWSECSRDIIQEKYAANDFFCLENVPEALFITDHSPYCGNFLVEQGMPQYLERLFMSVC